jgi:hypothetical protein
MTERLNDRLFSAFIGGWFTGVLAGTFYGGFYWEHLHVEFGRAVLVAVTTAQGVSLLISTIIIRKIEAELRGTGEGGQ